MKFKDRWLHALCECMVARAQEIDRLLEKDPPDQSHETLRAAECAAAIEEMAKLVKYRVFVRIVNPETEENKEAQS